LSGTDVHYEVNAGGVDFHYPDGVVGVVHYSTSVWHQWLMNVVRVGAVPTGCAYKFQQVGVRGCFKFVKITRIPADSTDYAAQAAYRDSLVKPVVLMSGVVHDKSSVVAGVTGGAMHVAKRPLNMQEALLAFHAKNVTVQAVAMSRRENMQVRAVWNTFLREFCVPGAVEVLAAYLRDPIVVDERGDRAPDDLMDKPVGSRAVVHHIGQVNMVFASVYRVLMRRFMSLLKPMYVNTLFDELPRVRATLEVQYRALVDPGAQYADYGSYDRSQVKVAHMLEEHILRSVGMRTGMLQQWGLGHTVVSRAGGTGMVVVPGVDTVVNMQASVSVVDSPYFASTFVLMHCDKQGLMHFPMENPCIVEQYTTDEEDTDTEE